MLTCALRADDQNLNIEIIRAQHLINEGHILMQDLIFSVYYN